MVDPFAGAERLMRMDERAWARHANPWSVWTRILTPVPMLAFSIWSRVWIGAWCVVPLALTIAWVWWNPRAFPPPRSLDAWASRAVLGERAYLRHRDRVPAHHRRAMAALTAASVLGILPLAWGLWALDAWAVAFGVLLAGGAKTWFVYRCAWLWDDLRREGAAWPRPANGVEGRRPRGARPP